MPNKTIYVADADLPVFDRAQELAGENLSATIAQALRRFIEAEEARAQGLGEITLKVGRKMTYTHKQFLGRELARHRDRDAQQSRLVTQTVFQTAKGRLVLYTRATPDWSTWSAFWADWGKDWGKEWDWNWSVDVDVDMDPHSDTARNEARAQARAEAKAEARARREEWRQRSRQARDEARAGRGGRSRSDWSDWSDWSNGGDYDMEVYESLEELKPHISDELYAAVARALRGDDVEFLDI
ncbi:MAG TPA: EXLDI protein [Ktedonobacterales bacterium]